MKKTLITTAILSVIFTLPQTANAALVDGSILNFDTAATIISSATLPVVGSGSYFSMKLEPNRYQITGITGFNNLILGSTQLATSNPVSANIDNPWNFAGNIGVHQSLSNTSIISSSGDTATIDFSGWGVSWNGIPIDLSSGKSNGIATVTCGTGSGCGNGASYELDYFAIIPSDSPNFTNVQYSLHLEGTISAVPVPAAVWLFGSGLLGLIGLARRKYIYI